MYNYLFVLYQEDEVVSVNVSILFQVGFEYLALKTRSHGAFFVNATAV